jgi:hypothetical protein
LAAFGKTLDALTNPTGILPTAVTSVLHETELRVFQLIPYWKLKFSPGTIRFERSKKILVDEIFKVIKQRRAQPIQGTTNI